jgi:hypothetical protein
MAGDAKTNEGIDRGTDLYIRCKNNEEYNSEEICLARLNLDICKATVYAACFTVAKSIDNGLIANSKLFTIEQEVVCTTDKSPSTR